MCIISEKNRICCLFNLLKTRFNTYKYLTIQSSIITLLNSRTITPRGQNEALSGVTMTLFRSRTVAFTVQVAYWILRVVAPTELVNHVNIDQRSGDLAVGSCGRGAILA